MFRTSSVLFIHTRRIPKITLLVKTGCPKITRKQRFSNITQDIGKLTKRHENWIYEPFEKIISQRKKDKHSSYALACRTDSHSLFWITNSAKVTATACKSTLKYSLRVVYAFFFNKWWLFKEQPFMDAAD